MDDNNPDLTSTDGPPNNGQATGSGTRVNGVASCRAPLTETDADGNFQYLENVTDTTLSFHYEAETQGPANASEAREMEEIPKGSDVATAFAFADELCGVPGWECIIYVSINDDDSRYNETVQGDNSYCDTVNGNGECFAYNGDILVHHNDDCTKDEIRDRFIQVMTDPNNGMSSDKYLENANFYARPDVSLPPADDERIVDVRLATGGSGDDGGSVIAGIAGTPVVAGASSQTVTNGAWIVVALVGALLLALILLLLAGRRKRSNKLSEEDVKSLKSMRSNYSKGASTAGNSYMTADMRNLGAMHSKLDVHKCKSATCEVCKPNLGKVNMVPVGKSSATTAIAMRHTDSSVSNGSDKFVDEKPWRSDQKPQQKRFGRDSAVLYHKMPADQEQPSPSSESSASGKEMLL